MLHPAFRQGLGSSLTIEPQRGGQGMPGTDACTGNAFTTGQGSRLPCLKEQGHQSHGSRIRGLVRAVAKESQQQQQTPAPTQRRHLPPFTITLDPKHIDERQLARLMALAGYSPCAFTSHGGRERHETPLLQPMHDTWQDPRSQYLQKFEREFHAGISVSTAPSIKNVERTLPRWTQSSSLHASQLHCAPLDTCGMPTVSPRKLRTAMDHSTVIVGLLVKLKAMDEDYMKHPDADSSSEEESGSRSGSEIEGLFRILPRGRILKDMRLVAFARASSDASLTAAIHDVVVHPDYHGLGLGRRVMQRMIRELQRYGVGDIALLCRPELRPYFRREGFASDRMRTTMMMYTREPWHQVPDLESSQSSREARAQSGSAQGQQLQWLPWGSKLLEVSSNELLPLEKRQSLTEMLRTGGIKAEKQAASPRLLVKLAS